jgi:hypothetical protein
MVKPRQALDQAGAKTSIVSPKHEHVRSWNHPEAAKRRNRPDWHYQEVYRQETPDPIPRSSTGYQMASQESVYGLAAYAPPHIRRFQRPRLRLCSPPLVSVRVRYCGDASSGSLSSSRETCGDANQCKTSAKSKRERSVPSFCLCNDIQRQKINLRLGRA